MQVDLVYIIEEDLLELFRFLHIDRAHLVCLSLGGRIAIDFALRHPDRVKSLVLAGPGLSGFEWSKDGEGQMLPILKAARDQGAEADAELWLNNPGPLTLQSRRCPGPQHPV